MLNSKRFKTPTILQMETVECGAASLSMILAYYGRFVPLEQLRYDCDVTRDGSKAGNILKAAKSYGLDAKGKKKEPTDFDQIRLPAIIHWNFNHFLVLEGIDQKRNKVYLNDPAEGHRVVSYQTFEESFTGVVLIFEPTPDFKKGGKRPNIFASFWSRLQGYKLDTLFVFLLSVLMIVPGILIPIFSQIFIDNVLIEGLGDWFLPLLTGMCITAILRAWMETLKNKYLLRIETKMSLATASSFFWHILRLPVDFFYQRYVGDIGSRVENNDQIARLISNELAKNTLDLFLVLFYFLIMLQYSLLLSIISLLFACLNVWALRAIASQREESYLRLQQSEGKLSGITMSGLQMIESIKARGGEDDFFKKWAGYMSKVVNAEQNLSTLSIVLNMIPHLLKSLTILAILTIGGWLIMEGQMTIGMLVAFQSLAQSFSEPIDNLVNLGGKLQEASGDIQRLDDILKANVDSQTKQATFFVHQKNDFNILTQKLEGYVEFRNVTFGYSRFAKPLIENFNLTIQPGERVALVGGSGSGKSTIAKLLAGLYEPWSGEILLDGIPQKKLPREIINNSLAMVDQDIFLFEGTTKELLTLWDNTIPEYLITQAAKDAQIHDLIGSRKNGYESIIAEGGRNLSGGQRQRIEIARALVGNPSILILDEATSALDPTTEKLIENSIKRRSCSVLVVAHRLSTIRDSDEIIVLRYGQIIERGTHEQLKKRNEAYAALIKM